MKMKSVMYSALILGLSVGVPAVAHHGSTAYDTTKVVAFKGMTVTKFLWASPHVIITFDAKDDQGAMKQWTAEAGTPQTLLLSGWSKSAVKVGDKLDVYLYQSKTGNPVGRLSKIVLADGTELKDSALGYDKNP
jgi:hypothetical protein